MRSDLFFLNHDVPEDAVKDGVLGDDVSKSNRCVMLEVYGRHTRRWRIVKVCGACRHEVAMVVGLTSYLLKQGYAPGEITVLTPYLKQLFDIRVCFRQL
jgi:hypothetical protein